MARGTHQWIGFAVAGICLVGSAHAQEPVLGGKQITESALIDALDPVIETRGFRPSVISQSRAPAPAAPGKAHLLITFEVDSAELSSETMAALDVLARALLSDQLAGLSFRVEGHADPRGLAERNQILSEQRAAAVVNYLVARRSIPADRLAPIGKGSTELIDPQRPDSAVNRRVTIITNRG